MSLAYDWCKEGHQVWFQEKATSQGALEGKKSYEELASSKWSSGAPFVTLPVKRVFGKEEGDEDSKSV